MSILIDQLPTAVEIDGREYPINTDFRVCLRVILAFEDNDLAPVEKQMVLLENLYPQRPENLEIALSQAVKFLNGGNENSEEDAEPSPRFYSFEKDANLIYAAFRQTHGIDLNAIEYLHWWKFIALFLDLGSDTAFCNLVSLRKRVKTGKATADEQQTAREMGEMAEAPEQLDTRTLDEKDRELEFLRMVEEAEQAREKK